MVESLILFDSYNTPYSRSDALKSLYALGNTEEIYKRIEMQAELDDGNLRIAAFSSFISEREKKKTAHKFCPKPLSFLPFHRILFLISPLFRFFQLVIFFPTMLYIATSLTTKPSPLIPPIKREELNGFGDIWILSFSLFCPSLLIAH